MLKRIKHWLLDNSLLLAIITSISIVILSLIPPSAVLSITTIKVSDKILHTIAYLGLSWVWLLVFQKVSIKQKIFLLIVLVLFGIILEFIQGELTDYRTADKYDAIANSFGIIIGFSSFKFLYLLVFSDVE